jgi:PEGA domain-containing protein
MIFRRMLRGPVLLGMALLALPMPRAARAQSAKDEPVGVENEKALQTFKEGIEAFDRRDFEAARVAFLQTFALKPSAPVVRRNLGLAEIYSGHYLDGARRLGRVIHTTDEGTSMDRARMVESLKKAEAHLERITVEVNVEGAEIQIGDVDLGVSPLPFAWYLEPGSYDVRISKPGFAPYSETRLARAGNAQHLRVHLKPLGAMAEPSPALETTSEPVTLPPPELDRTGPSPWILIVGSTLTAGGLVGGLTLTLLAADNADKVERIGDTLTGVGCIAPNGRACAELADAAAEHDRQLRWATVSFALGAAAGVSTIVYALLSSSHRSSMGAPSSASSVAQRFGISVDGSGTQLYLDGSF